MNNSFFERIGWMAINPNPFMLTRLFMFRDLLISKEQMKRVCSGKSYRQFDHRTPLGGKTYKESVGDDLESFFNDQKVRRSPLIGYTEETWTYFIRELTEEELHLVQKKDRGFFEKFRWSTDPDIDETEMSTSTSKYISAYCNRHTEYGHFDTVTLSLMPTGTPSLMSDRYSDQPDEPDVIQLYNTYCCLDFCLNCFLKCINICCCLKIKRG